MGDGSGCQSISCVWTSFFVCQLIASGMQAAASIFMSMTKQAQPQIFPAEIRVVQANNVLELYWQNDNKSRIDAATLRANCPSANAKRMNLDGRSSQVDADLTISKIRPVGNYAINIVFSDGYDRGIYPWSYLSELGQITERSAQRENPFLSNSNSPSAHLTDAHAGGD